MPDFCPPLSLEGLRLRQKAQEAANKLNGHPENVENAIPFADFTTERIAQRLRSGTKREQREAAGLIVGAIRRYSATLPGGEDDPSGQAGRTLTRISCLFDLELGELLNARNGESVITLTHRPQRKSPEGR